MTWVTKIYLAIKNAKTPFFIRELTSWLTIHVLIPTLTQFANKEIHELEYLIVKASNMDMPGMSKLEWVAKEYYSRFNDTKPRDVLNYAIETLIQRLKVQGIIKF